MPSQSRASSGVAPAPAPDSSPTAAPLGRGNSFYQDLLRDVPPPAPGGGGSWGALIDRIWSGVEAEERAQAPADAASVDASADASSSPAASPAVSPAASPASFEVAQVMQHEADHAPPIAISPSGRQAMDGLAGVANDRVGKPPMGRCYNYVMGAGGNAYVNRAAAERGTSRWQQLANRIPSDHSQWAVSFAHWLQETASGRKAAQELGFVIYESDGKTRLGDYLAAHPELKGSVVVIPYGQQGTASQEWNAAAHYGDRKWGAGVGDISVVTQIGAKGATYVADGKIGHDAATMWWVVYPR